MAEKKKSESKSAVPEPEKKVGDNPEDSRARFIQSSSMI